MGQLFDRFNRLIRAELNARQKNSENNYLDEGTALIAGGAVAGASIGKVGILAGGTGYSLGAVPLAAAGALTGAALYEVLRSILEGDASSTGAAAISAIAGATTSAAIGGVGVAVGGSAIGVGMAPMAAGGAVVGLGLVGLNRLLQQGIDPEKLLDSAIEQMAIDVHRARQAIVNVIAAQRRLQQQYDQAEAEVNRWKQRAQLALQKGDEPLAREALNRKSMHNRTLDSIRNQLDQEPTSVEALKKNLVLLEAKIVEAKTMRTRLKAQLEGAQINGQLYNTPSSAVSGFERMEEKMLQMEARSQIAAELSGLDLESQFAQLESGSNVDPVLAEMKAQLLGVASPNQAQISSASIASTVSLDAVDVELEALKSQLDQL